MKMKIVCCVLVLLAVFAEGAFGAERSGLEGKVMCGYQGWFNTPGDGTGRGWRHWGFRSGRSTVDLWPDMTELGADEKYATEFKHADGSTAYVFSSNNKKTVTRHFKWMADYGIDGVFVQRFAGEVFNESGLKHFNTVLSHCRGGANLYGREYAVMYDLSGMRAGQMGRVIDDWKKLVDGMGITKDRSDGAYMQHKGKPVVAVWGIGFSDGRNYTLDECLQLVNFLKDDPKYGGNTVMIGVPTFWRTLRRDCVSDAKIHEIAKSADIISPWMVGRFNRPEQVDEFAREVWAKDIEWCKKNGKDYLPVLWPGFSWANLKRKPEKSNAVPRLSGRFLWKQYVEAKKAGATMIYQAMFDEVDEATSIFKCTNDPPVGDEAKFIDYEGLPSDHYLWLTGQGGKLIRDEIKVTEKMPERK